MTVRTSQAKKRASRTGGNPARVKQISKSTAQIVKDAAALLDEEVAEGIVAARQMQQRFRKERRIDANDFNQALQKFQGDAHELITNFNDQLGELRSEENADLMKRLVSNTHDVVDLTVEMVNMGAEIANQLAQSTLKRGVKASVQRGVKASVQRGVRASGKRGR